MYGEHEEHREHRKHEFLSELQILLEYKHENIISLVGYCDERDEQIIVYEYASRGSLDCHLKDSGLTWTKRLEICIDIATGLDFLHGGAATHDPVIHRDIKSGNILLNDDWTAKISDFGISLISPINKDIDFVIDDACGTIGYWDPAYIEKGFLTEKSDIYSFGAVLLEVLYGRLLVDVTCKDLSRYLINLFRHQCEEGILSEMVFEGIKEKIVPKSLSTFQMLVLQCLLREREKRPTAGEVRLQLKKALEFQMESTSATTNNVVIPPAADKYVPPIGQNVHVLPHSHVEQQEKFNGFNFTKWQENMHFYLTTLNLAGFLTGDVQEPRVTDAWKQSDFLCRSYVLNGLEDALYNMYSGAKSAKELWESLDRKYGKKDVNVVAQFLDYKIMESKSIVDQLQELQIIINDIHAEGMLLPETFQVAAIIEKLPPTWVDLKKYLNHRRKEMSVEDLIVQLRNKEGNAVEHFEALRARSTDGQ